MMDVANTNLIERVARVLAAQLLSANAGGAEPSAAPDVADAWSHHVPAAIAILKTMREPDQAMAAAGDLAIWSRMIEAALQSAN